MDTRSSIFKRTGRAVPYLLLLLAVYLIANACAGPQSTSGEWLGSVLVDSLPPATARLHIHATCIKPNSDATGEQVMTEDSIPLLFYQIQTHDVSNGKDYFGKYSSNYNTIGRNYAEGSWNIDSAFVDDGTGGAWEGKVLSIPSQQLPTYNDTLDFTR